MTGVVLAGCGGTPADVVEPAAAPSAEPWAPASADPSTEAVADETPTVARRPGEAPAWAPGVPRAPLPRRVLVPRLRIDASLDPLGLHRRTSELVPPRYGRAGWYAAGPEPGEPGRAVIAGHLDSADGADVFARLADARPGDRIVVQVAGGGRLTFRVQRVGLFPQSEFPTGLVYGGARRDAEIRLITCGGPYDRRLGRYQSNVVVFGRLVGRG